MSLLSAPLQAFLAIVEHGTVHAAAKELKLTQTGVTQRIRALESQLGTTLFLRSRRGMKLTREGESLLRYCRGAKDLEGECLAGIHNAGSKSPVTVTIAGPTSIMSSRIAEACIPLYVEWPNLHLNLHVSDLEDRVQMVRSGKAAIAVVPPELVVDEMDSKVLKPDRYLLVASKKWKGRRLTDILENERVIDFGPNDPTTLNYLKKFGFSISRQRLFVNNNEALIKMFIEGIGFGTLTQSIAEPFLDSGKLVVLNNGAVLEDPLALAWYPRPEVPAYFQAILKVIK